MRHIKRKIIPSGSNDTASQKIIGQYVRVFIPAVTIKEGTNVFETTERLTKFKGYGSAFKRDPALTQQRVHAGISVRTGGIFPDRKAVNAVIFLDDGYSSPALLECDVQNFFASSEKAENHPVIWDLRRIQPDITFDCTDICDPFHDAMIPKDCDRARIQVDTCDSGNPS